MDTPFPNPQDGAATKKTSGTGQREQSAGGRRGRAPSRRRRRDILAPHQVPTKFEYEAIDPHSLSTPGPSGIKQCFRTVKHARRIPVLAGPSAPPPPPPPPPPPQPPPLPPPLPLQLPSAPSPPSKRHHCRLCNKRFSSPGKRDQHLLSHTGELPFPCSQCDKRFNSKFKLVRHGLIHNETRPFSCSTCLKTFHRKDHLVNHQKTHNPIKVAFVCKKENCKKQYTSQLSFKKHTALHSAEEGNLECKMCSKVFENQADIVYHLKVHAGSRSVKSENDKKFKCPQCESKFFTLKDVRRHMVVHTGSRDFPCQFCKQKFGRKDHLVRHVKKAHPNESWQSSTPGVSTAPSFVAVPKSSPPLGSKKGKGEAKKSKTKAELKFLSETPEEGVKISVKSERPSTAFVECADVYHFEPREQSLIQGPSEMIKIPQIFLQGDTLVQIKHEPITEMDENRVLFESLPSTSKDIEIMLPPVDPQPSTSMGKYQEYPQGMIYVMSPPPYTVLPQTMDMMEQEDLTFVTQPESELLPVMEGNRDTLSLLVTPEIGSIMSEEEVGGFSSQPIISLLGSTVVPEQSHEQKTVLPNFQQTFHSTAQSPKPPQHPPK